MEITELLNNAFGFMDDKLTLDQISSGIDAIVAKYNSEFYPFEVRESGGGWQFLSKKAFHKTIAQLNGEKFLKRLSIAALGNPFDRCLQTTYHQRRNRIHPGRKQRLFHPEIIGKRTDRNHGTQ